jgi:hypothetical protein
MDQAVFLLCHGKLLIAVRSICYHQAMNKANKTVPTNQSVDAFLARLEDKNTIADCHVLIALMRQVSGHEPIMWGTGIIGFGSYHYRYESGREGDSPSLAFHPANGRITVYLVGGGDNFVSLLASLGKHKRSGSCLHLKRLSDINLPVLKAVLQKSFNTASING